MTSAYAASTSTPQAWVSLGRGGGGNGARRGLRKEYSAPHVNNRKSSAASAAASNTNSTAEEEDAASGAASTTPQPAGNARNTACSSKVVVLDGANLAWTFSAALYSKLGCKTRLPLSRGVTLAMECDTWTKMGLEPVAFMPESYVEGPLHGLADGGSLDTLVPGNVVYVGDSRWRNTVLWDLREAGRLVAVARPAGARDADDREILSFARGSNAMICSNDRYEDHIAGAGSSDASKELRRWLASNRTGGDVRGRKRDEGARGGVVGGKMKKGVKSEESPRNGYFYVLPKKKKTKWCQAATYWLPVQRRNP